MYKLVFCLAHWLPPTAGQLSLPGCHHNCWLVTLRINSAALLRVYIYFFLFRAKAPKLSHASRSRSSFRFFFFNFIFYFCCYITADSQHCAGHAVEVTNARRHRAAAVFYNCDTFMYFYILLQIVICRLPQATFTHRTPIFRVF